MPRATLSHPEWHARRIIHERRVDTWVEPHLERRSRGERHPVEDFLFTYYSFSPSALRRWHPGIGVAIEGGDLDFLRHIKGYAIGDGRAQVDPQLTRGRCTGVASIRRLLQATRDRPLALGCFGLHEWAMVYRQDASELRHAAYPLRLGGAGTDRVVESHRISCTHYDAFRFFTAPARPRNALQPSRGAQPELEQPGCLHATMDLYKWAYKLSPFTSAELVADCFALARDVRLVDMQAAPYDLSALGVRPISIETAAGKSEYVSAQRSFAATGQQLRGRLIDVCDEVMAAARPGPNGRTGQSGENVVPLIC